MTGRVLVLLLVLAYTAPSTAEVYRWVDEQGKVHFGDKPRDEATAAQAEQVEIREAYPAGEGKTVAQHPAVPTAASVAARRERDRQRAEEERAAREKRAAARRDRCEKLEEEYRLFTEVRMVNGRPVYHYARDETGRSLTSAEQREYLAEVKRWSEEAGCPPL